MQIDERLKENINIVVKQALDEDIGEQDITSSLIEKSSTTKASILTRQKMILAGTPWAEEVYKQLDSRIKMNWKICDGQEAAANAVICEIEGPAHPILSGERTALNFLQTLSATASTTAKFVEVLAGSSTKLLDTRKTIPGLRWAQKYAVRCGGALNHRFGLFDAILIKENHISIEKKFSRIIKNARKNYPTMPIEIEVETLEDMQKALKVKSEYILLDNFPYDLLVKAVAINKLEGNPPAKLEASGGFSINDVKKIASIGLDYISVGALTKNINSIDISMLFKSNRLIEK